MQLMRSSGPLVLALALATGFARPAAAQTISNSDIQRLQDSIYEASRDVASCGLGIPRRRRGSRPSSTTRAMRPMYLKVKLRKNEQISRSDYTEVRDRIDSIRNRARGDVAGNRPAPSGVGIGDDRPSSSPSASGNDRVGTSGRSDPNEIPVGTEFDVRLANTLSSKTAQVEDRFEATTMVDLRDEQGRVLVPAGSTMRGVVSSVNKATRTDRKGSMTVAFDRVTINGRAYPLRATVTQAIESEGIMGEKEKIGIGAGAGAILGAILGGAKGALAGILIGGGGTIAATEGKDVELPAGTVLRVRLDSALALQR